MGAAISEFIQWFWILVAAIKPRDLAHSSALSPSLAPFLSPSAALATMPKLLESRPWRHCTDRNNTVWEITSTTTFTSRFTHTNQTHALANEAFRLPEWIMCTLSFGKNKRDAQEEEIKVVYHVPYLEAWADAVAAAGADVGHLAHLGQELAAKLTQVAEGASSGTAEARNVVYGEDVAVGKMATGMKDVTGHYREALDIKPGVFELMLGEEDGSVKLGCPNGIRT